MAETCYRHPDRETGVSCSSCGRPICPDCMTPTPVGMRCPECMRERTKVVRNPGGAPQAGFMGAPATYVLIAINVVVYLVAIAGGTGGINNPNGSVYLNTALFGPSVAEGEWYRLLSNGFMHASLFHIAFNMFALFVVGRVLEPALGTARFVTLYFASLLAGSFGVMLIDPDAVTVGASGAIFGIFGATMMIARGRGMNEIAGQIGFLIAINLLITFGVPGISIGGHLGGLVGGLICATAIVAGEKGRFGPNHRAAEFALMIAVGVLSLVGAIAIA